MSKFKIGDKVRILDGSKINKYTGGWNKIDMSNHIGEVHKIIDIHETCGDSPCAAYTLDFEGSCRFYKWDERGLELVSKKIVITTDGKTTTAVLYDGKQRIKEAKAVCAPTDEFNFKYGAALALSRLNDDKTTFGKRADKIYVDEFAKGEYFTGKARCIRVDSRQTTCLTKGKIYEFVDGHSVDDMGEQLPLVTQIHSIKELNKILYSDFEEVVEKKSQMDRFIDGEIYLEVPKEKIKSFLEECERANLRWASGDKATQYGEHKKYFKVLLNHLTYSKERVSTEPWEIWDGAKATNKIETKPDDGVLDILKVMAKLVAFMKDDLDD